LGHNFIYKIEDCQGLNLSNQVFEFLSQEILLHFNVIFQIFNAYALWL